MPSPAAGTALHLALRGFLELGSRLPWPLATALGTGLSAAALRAIPKDRRRIEAHLQIAFPELERGERDRIITACARHFGSMLAEIAWLWRARPEDVLGRCEPSGLEHFRAAAASGRGAVFTTGHCGNWELLNAWLLVAEVPLTIAVRQLDNRRLDAIVTRLRSRFGAEVVPRGSSAGRQLASALAHNRVCGLLIDQDIRDVPGVFVPFFDRPAWTPSGAAVLALRRGCPLIPGFIARLPDGRHRVEIHPPLPVPQAGSFEDRVRELTAAATAAIEAQVRAHPEQWVWMHRRWRTRPPTAPPTIV
ncbi:MAG: lysophospholipid acyltransferase family protein [Thermoanaerobaculales bacterium]|jgi:KDO2-lipid IV(A) lauroyltransferase|nr:lysophospholipid acyltransferase family protein [Thermoanaerobaculales bacterium]